MRRSGPASFWIARVLAIGIVASLAGCASGGSSAAVPVTDVKSLAGKWGGVAQGPGSSQQDYVEMSIREDGTYDVTTSRTIGRYAGNGRVTLRDGQLTFEGANSTGVGSLMTGSGGEKVLQVTVSFAGPGGVPNNVSANLRPAR